MKKTATKPCARCKTAQIPDVYHFKYCAPCRREVDVESKRASRAKRKATDKTAPTPIPSDFAASIDACMDEAKEAIKPKACEEVHPRNSYIFDKGRVLTPAEIAAIAHTITPPYLIPEWHFAGDGAMYY